MPSIIIQTKSVYHVIKGLFAHYFKLSLNVDQKFGRILNKFMTKIIYKIFIIKLTIVSIKSHSNINIFIYFPITAITNSEIFDEILMKGEK
jgi:hypothetical protein